MYSHNVIYLIKVCFCINFSKLAKVSGQMYRRTLTTKMFNGLKGQKKTRKYKHFLRGGRT